MSAPSPTIRDPRVTLVQNFVAGARSSISSCACSYFEARRAASAESVNDPTTAKQNSRVGSVRIAI